MTFHFQCGLKYLTGYMGEYRLVRLKNPIRENDSQNLWRSSENFISFHDLYLLLKKILLNFSLIHFQLSSEILHEIYPQVYSFPMNCFQVTLFNPTRPGGGGLVGPRLTFVVYIPRTKNVEALRQ